MGSTLIASPIHEIRSLITILENAAANDRSEPFSKLKAAVLAWSTDKTEIADATPAQRAERSRAVSRVRAIVMSLDANDLDSSDWSEAFGEFTIAFRAAANAPCVPKELDADILRELHKNLG